MPSSAEYSYNRQPEKDTKNCRMQQSAEELVVVVIFFSRERGFWENVRPFIPCLHFFVFVFLSGY